VEFKTQDSTTAIQFLMNFHWVISYHTHRVQLPETKRMKTKIAIVLAVTTCGLLNAQYYNPNTVRTAPRPNQMQINLDRARMANMDAARKAAHTQVTAKQQALASTGLWMEGIPMPVVISEFPTNITGIQPGSRPAPDAATLSRQIFTSGKGYGNYTCGAPEMAKLQRPEFPAPAYGWLVQLSPTNPNIHSRFWAFYQDGKLALIQRAPETIHPRVPDVKKTEVIEVKIIEPLPRRSDYRTRIGLR
jgi:hypothetical protein